MPKPIKGEIMSQAEMIEAVKQKRNTSSIYKAESMQLSAESISQIVTRGLAEIVSADSEQKIDLSDVDMVKEVSQHYIKACADCSTLPSLAGLARAMGCTRNALYHWMNKKPQTETSKYLWMCHDLFSDLLSEASLRNNVNSIVAIFLQKAQYGLRDNVTLEISQTQNDDDDYDYNPNYKEKYRNLIGE